MIILFENILVVECPGFIIRIHVEISVKRTTTITRKEIPGLVPVSVADSRIGVQMDFHVI